MKNEVNKQSKVAEKKLMIALEKIAAQHLDFTTLKSRNYDGFDFQEVSIWGVEAALKAAYALGVAAGKTQANSK